MSVALAPPEDYAPRSLRSLEVRQRRRAMLHIPHVAPLTAYVDELRKRPDVEVPDFDPLDGGVNAQALFLFEKPGPMTSDGPVRSRVGSGFISRNNDDPSAEATHAFMATAGIPRERTVSWNTVPWWNGTRKITRVERREGVERAQALIALLPKLRVVFLVGVEAGRAQALFTSLALPIVRSDHPSPLVRARWPERWRAIPTVWASGASLLGE